MTLVSHLAHPRSGSVFSDRLGGSWKVSVGTCIGTINQKWAAQVSLFSSGGEGRGEEASHQSGSWEAALFIPKVHAKGRSEQPSSLRAIRAVTASALLLLLAAHPLFAGPSPSDAPPRSQRSPTEDVLLLASGETITGTILNETFRVRTSYAVLELKKRFIAGLDFTHTSHGLVFVTTVNSNQFTGLLEAPSFRVQSANGQQQELRRERVSRVSMSPPKDPAPIKQGQWVRLKAGDVFTGQPAEGPPASSQEREDLAFTLDLGPTIRLYRDSIDCLVQGTNGLAEPQTSGSVVPAGIQSTNHEGLVWIVPGEFMMGSTSEETGRDPDEGPQTKVRFVQGFWMGRCEVTQAEYQPVMGLNPSHATGDPSRPVDRVNWFEAVAYCKKLTESAEAAGTLPKGYAYRLPTEAEWEYACRAGSNTRFSYGDDPSDLNLADYAWFARNSESTTHPVGTKRPNAWGLSDMHGNVWEWCLDRWEGALPGGVLTNAPAAATGGLRTARGGSWLYDGKACRSANRDDYSPFNRCSDVGFRVVLARVEP